MKCRRFSILFGAGRVSSSLDDVTHQTAAGSGSLAEHACKSGPSLVGPCLNLNPGASASGLFQGEF